MFNSSENVDDESFKIPQSFSKESSDDPNIPNSYILIPTDCLKIIFSFVDNSSVILNCMVCSMEFNEILLSPETLRFIKHIPFTLPTEGTDLQSIKFRNIGKLIIQGGENPTFFKAKSKILENVFPNLSSITCYGYHYLHLFCKSKKFAQQMKEVRIKRPNGLQDSLVQTRNRTHKRFKYFQKSRRSPERIYLSEVLNIFINLESLYLFRFSCFGDINIKKTFQTLTKLKKLIVKDGGFFLPLLVPSITHLKLWNSGYNVKRRGVIEKTIFPQLKNLKLEVLLLRKCSFVIDWDLEQCLKGSIKWLDLENCRNITGKTLSYCEGTIEYLNISNCRKVTTGLKFIEDTIKVLKIESSGLDENLINNSFSPTKLKCLHAKNYYRLKRITNIIQNLNYLDVNMVSNISDFSILKNLKVLLLRHNLHLRDHHMKHFENSQIQVLDITRTKVTNKGIGYVADIIQEISISYIKDTGDDTLKLFENNRGFRGLTARNIGLTDRGLEYLKDCPIEILVVSYNPIMGHSLKFFSNHRFKLLNLCHTKIKTLKYLYDTYIKELKAIRTSIDERLYTDELINMNRLKCVYGFPLPYQDTDTKKLLNSYLRKNGVKYKYLFKTKTRIKEY